MPSAQAAAATIERADVALSIEYSPRRVRFWLAHWDELESLVETPRSSGHVGRHLAREWQLLNSDARYRYADCICRMDSDPGCAGEPRGPRGYRVEGDGRHILADLTRAAEQLPPHWQATREIFAQQGRAGQWEFRRGVWERGARGRPVDRAIEPQVGAYMIACDLMARVLGWQPRGL